MSPVLVNFKLVSIWGMLPKGWPCDLILDTSIISSCLFSISKLPSFPQRDGPSTPFPSCLLPSPPSPPPLASASQLVSTLPQPAQSYSPPLLPKHSYQQEISSPKLKVTASCVWFLACLYMDLINLHVCISICAILHDLKKSCQDWLLTFNNSSMASIQKVKIYICIAAIPIGRRKTN